MSYQVAFSTETNMRLNIRTRKLIGTLVLLVFLTLYSFLVMTIAVSHLPDNGFVQFAYYLTAGVIWAFPMKYLIIWMVRPDEEPEEGHQG